MSIETEHHPPPLSYHSEADITKEKCLFCHFYIILRGNFLSSSLKKCENVGFQNLTGGDDLLENFIFLKDIFDSRFFINPPSKVFLFYDLNVWINGLKFMETLEFQLGKNELVRNYLHNAELNALLRILILPVILMRKVF